jgi:hypothetical protein
MKHLQAFAKTHGVAATDVHVRVTLTDGSETIIQGFKASGPTGSPPNWGMIESSGKEALVIRETSVLKVNFQMAPSSSKKIGFHAEGA